MPSNSHCHARVALQVEHPEMVKREHPETDFTADEDDGEPVAQRVNVEEPDHLLCPITHEMFRDPVVLMSGHTYERAAIERHLRVHGTDPLTRERIRIAPVTNMSMRNVVHAWLDRNPGVTPDGLDTREMLPPQRTQSPDSPMEYHRPDLEVLREWRESCPELRDLWRQDDPGHWYGVTWSDGRVTSLELFEKGLSGSLPRLEGLTSLEEVVLSGNKLTGSIPEKLFQGLTSLKEVYLANNQLSGSIPEKLFQSPTSLQVVDLHGSIYGNKLSGSIPEKLFEGLTSLQRVLLNSNQLTGSIPEKLFQSPTSLREVYLHGNKLSKSIPEKLFEGLTSLEKVHLGNNQLSGSIPEKLFEGLSSLQIVFLFGNQLSGSIPEKLCEGMTSLQEVDLSDNKLSGSIPERFREIVQM